VLRSIEIIESWLMIQEASGKAPSTLREYRLHVTRFARWLWCPPRGRSLEQATSSDCAAYLVAKQREHLAALTIRTNIYALRPLFRWMVDEGLIARDPIAKIPVPKFQPPERSHGMSVQDVAKLLRAPDPSRYLGLRDRALLQVLWELGIRRSEAAAMRLPDVDLTTGRVYVRSVKREKPRVLLLGPAGLEWLEKWIRRRGEEDQATDFVWVSRIGVPITAHMITKMISTYAAKSGFDSHTYASGFRSGRIHSHSLRHACATEALRDGADIVSVSRWLGHSSIRSTQSYLDVDEREMEGISMRRPEIW